MILILSAACTTTPPRAPDPPTVIEVPVDRYVPIDEELTKKGEVVSVPPRNEVEAMSGKGILIFLRWMALSNEENLIQCYNQLDEIATLGKE